MWQNFDKWKDHRISGGLFGYSKSISIMPFGKAIMHPFAGLTIWLK
jgi:hypothetical protein